MTRYVIVRGDGLSDAIVGRMFASYDEAYTVLESYSADFCCSDERESYRIEEEADAPQRRSRLIRPSKR